MRPRNPPAAGRFPLFAASFAKAMTTKQLTARAVAKLLGINISTVYGYLGGVSRPSTANLYSFQAALGGTFDMSEAGKIASHDPAEALAGTIANRRDRNIAKHVRALNGLGYAVELRPI